MRSEYDFVWSGAPTCIWERTVFKSTRGEQNWRTVGVRNFWTRINAEIFCWWSSYEAKSFEKLRNFFWKIFKSRYRKYFSRMNLFICIFFNVFFWTRMGVLIKKLKINNCVLEASLPVTRLCVGGFFYFFGHFVADWQFEIDKIPR